MLYRMLKSMIEKGMTQGLGEKLDIFFATGKLTQVQYEELTGKLAQADKPDISL